MASYSVDTRGEIPTLIRWECPYIYTFSPLEPGEWVESPGKASMVWGQGDFVWYDDISEAEALKYMEQIRKAVKNRKGG